MKLKARVGIYVALALLLVATFAFRVPSLFEPPWYDDEGIYAAVAHALLRGETLYDGVLDNRPPGIYWLYAAMLSASGYSVPFIKLVTTVFLLLTQVTVFHIAWRVWNARSGLVAVALLGFLGSLPLLEGNIANAENFMILPTALGVLLLLQGRFFLAGVALSLAFLIKQVAGVEFVACFLALLLFHPRPLAKLGVFSLGYSVPIALAAFYLFTGGTLDDFLFAGFGYYLGYVQRATRIPIEFWLLKLLLLITASVGIWWHYRGQKTAESFRVPLVALWAAYALYGALFTSRPYPHYLLQPLPPLLLVTGAFIANWNKPLAQTTVGKVASLTGLSVAGCWVLLAIYMPWPGWAKPEKTQEYYQNFVLYMSGQRSFQAYNDFFDKRVNRNLSLVERLRSNTKPGDSLFVWGEEPWLYALTRLRVAAPYTVSYFAYEMPSGLDRVVVSLQKRKPIYVVWTMNKPLYPKLKDELDQNYKEISVVGNAAVFQRSNTLTSVAQPLPLIDTRAITP